MSNIISFPKDNLRKRVELLEVIVQAMAKALLSQGGAEKIKFAIEVMKNDKN